MIHHAPVNNNGGGSMTSEEFAAMVDRLQGHLLEAATAFLVAEGVKPDWLAYWKEATTDLEQHAREILFLAGDCWPGTADAV